MPSRPPAGGSSRRVRPPALAARCGRSYARLNSVAHPAHGTTFFRIFVAIPILVVLGSVARGTWQWSYDNTTAAAAGSGGLVFLGPLLMILFRQKYPRWWFDWNL
ncbi:hypothetical protein [Kribbella sp. NBC_00889]|uniref:hypothetical protein n=1 Tax=Kribbella sp. NBC_00889 TaxID=2975974 RepID=UPI003870DE5C|nr:hypothetical protein OG817_40340 [Kribbella sp. NBC_00889]